MNRFILTLEATRDLDDILIYNKGLPLEPGNRIGRSLQHMLKEIRSSPLHGTVHEELSRLYGEEVRSRIVAGYVHLLRSYRNAAPDPRHPPRQTGPRLHHAHPT